MERKCCALLIVKQVLGRELCTQEGRAAAHSLIYLVQEVLGVKLGYRFRWLARGPYSRALSTDLRTLNPCTCSDPAAVELPRELSLKLSTLRVGLAKALTIAASYVMLKKDVYPPIGDVAGEVARRFKVPRAVVVEVAELLSQYLRRAKPSYS